MGYCFGFVMSYPFLKQLNVIIRLHLHVDSNINTLSGYPMHTIFAVMSKRAKNNANV